MNRSAGEPRVTDTELVRRAQAGAQAAFAELMRRYQDRVFNTCYRMCGNHAEAHDLAQTAFLRAYEALPRFAGASGFYTWLFRIAVNVVQTERRRRRRHPTLQLSTPSDDTDLPSTEPSALADPVEAVDRDELRARLCDALADLDEEFRMAVILRDIEGLDYAAIADLLEIPIGTVKSRIARGRMLLRARLCAEGETGERAGA